MSRSLESVLGLPQNNGQGDNGNFVQRANERKHISAAHVKDPRRFSDASGVIPPPRPPPPNPKRLRNHNMNFDWRFAGNPATASRFLAPSHPNMQFQPQQQTRGVTNLTKMAHLAKSSPQIDSDTDKEKEREREGDREKVRERYPPQQIQVDKETLIAQVWTFSVFLFLFIFKILNKIINIAFHKGHILCYTIIYNVANTKSEQTTKNVLYYLI